MKNFKLFLLAMTLIASNVFGQKYFFKQEYAPNSEYEMVIDLVGNTDMKVIAPKLGEQTMKMEQIMKMGMKIITQKLEENKIPFSMKYSNFEVKMKMNGQEMNSKENPLGSMETTGVIENGNKMSIIDIKGKVVSEEIKEMIKNQSSQMAQFVVDFPKDGMQIGDTFVQEMPYSMNVSQSANIEMQNIIEYKLKKIEGNKAYFDTKIKVVIDAMMNKEFKMNGEGAGEGTAEFDTQINQFSKMDSGVKMTVMMDMGEVGKMDAHFDMITAVQTKKLK